MNKKDTVTALELRVRHLTEKRKQLHEAIKDYEYKANKATESYVRTDRYYQQMLETNPRNYKAESHASALEYRCSQMHQYRQLARTYNEQDQLLLDEILFLNNVIKLNKKGFN